MWVRKARLVRRLAEFAFCSHFVFAVFLFLTVDLSFFRCAYVVRKFLAYLRSYEWKVARVIQGFILEAYITVDDGALMLTQIVCRWRPQFDRKTPSPSAVEESTFTNESTESLSNIALTDPNWSNLPPSFLTYFSTGKASSSLKHVRILKLRKLTMRSSFVYSMHSLAACRRHTGVY